MNDAPRPSPTDPLKRRATRLNFWLVWGFAVFDVVLALLPTDYGSEVKVLLRIAIVTCQVSLLTIWVALGQDVLKERLVMVAPAYALVAWFFASMEFHGATVRRTVFAMLLLYLFNATIPYGLLRLLGVRLVWAARSSNRPNAKRVRRPVQFSLAALFKATFVAACAAGLIRLLKPEPVEFVGEIALLSLASLFGLGGIWSMLAGDAWVPRAAVCFVVSILGGLAIDRIISQIIHSRPEPWPISLWVTSHLAVMLGVLTLHRWFGYRAVRG